MLWIGHFDLTASMGIAGQFDHPRYAAALAAVVEACERHGDAAGISTDDADRAVEPARSGFRFIAVGHDIVLLRDALQSASPPSAPRSPDPREELHDAQAAAAQRPRPARRSAPTPRASAPATSSSSAAAARSTPTTGTVRGESVAEQTEARARQRRRHPRGRRRRARADVVKATVHLADETTFPEFNEVYARRMPEPRPVRHDRRQRVAPGRPGCGVEIDVIAYVG